MLDLTPSLRFSLLPGHSSGRGGKKATEGADREAGPPLKTHRGRSQRTEVSLWRLKGDYT